MCQECERLRDALADAQDSIDRSRESDVVVLLRRHWEECHA